jgi:NAD(P)-dependent dehydrogenase (short-subunit alcohol dehydrogenase family)
MLTGMTTTLITGANKGLGRETARRLVEAGHTVYVAARDEGRGKATAAELGARFVQLDVSDPASVAAAVTSVAADGGLDVLVNNAGVEPRLGGNAIPTATDETPELMSQTFETNVFGTLRVLHAFLPLLEKSPAPVIVNVSSGLASLSGLADPSSPTHFYPGISYPASKAAVNAITIQYAKQYPRLRVNAVEPGFTNTDLNGRTGTQSVAEGAEIIVRMATIGPDGPTGTYTSVRGAIPW